MATAYTTNKLGVQLNTGDTDYVAAFNATQSRIDTLLGNGIINVKGFADQAGTYREAGGVGGAGDDAIIQLAVARATATGETLYFPSGTYLSSTQITVRGFGVMLSPKAVLKPATATTNMVKLQVNCSWVGGIVNVEAFTNYSGDVFTVDGTYVPSLGQTTLAPYIKDVYIYGQNHVNNRGCGVKFYIPGVSGQFISYCLVDNVRVYRMYRAIYLYLDDANPSGAWLNGNLFSNISIGSTTLPIELYAKPGTDGVCGNIFQNIMIQPTGAAPGPTVDVIKLTNSSFNQFNNTYIWDPQNITGYIANVVSGEKNRFNTPLPTENIFDGGVDSFFAGVSNATSRNATLGTTYHYDWAPNDYSSGVTPAPLTANTKYVSDAIAWGDCVLGDFLLVGSPRLQAVDAHYLGMAQAHVTASGYFKIVCTNQLPAATITPDSDDWYIMRIPNRRRTMQYSHAPGSIAAGAQVAIPIPVPGAALEDFIIATPDKEISDFMWSITISSVGNASLVLHNFASAAVNPGTILWSLKLIKSEKANVVCGSMRTPALTAGSSNMNQFTIALTTDVRVGDFVLFSPASDISGLMVFPQMTSANGLKVGCFNGTGGDLGALPTAPAYATWRACWIKADDGFMFL